VNRKMRVDGPFVSHGFESAFSAAGVSYFIDMVGVAYLTERASLSSNLVQQSSFVHEDQ
jgi:hypothetical protein